MELFDFMLTPEHRYSLAATGIKFRDGEFSTRELANKAMYKFINTHGLKIEKVYDDKHYKTYICNDGVRFYVNRI